MKKAYSIVASLLLGSAAAMAVPAMPGIHRLVQPDGSIIEASIIGDEKFHYYETTGGELLLCDSLGVLRPATVTADGQLAAIGEITGKATPAPMRERIMKAISQRHEAIVNSDLSKIAPNVIPQKFQTTGEIKGLILLVEYQDVKLTAGATREHYEALCNEPGYSSEAAHGSVLDYFSDQSRGRFTPHFDVVGPLTLPRERAYYGLNEHGLVNQFRDAALAADAAGLDFSQYDSNGDGFVDFLFVIFAGHGEAQGGPAESVWPAMQDLTYYVFDYFDDVNLGVAACSCELKGAEGEVLDGISTICHEFSHILGLADIYDTSNQGGHGMGHYDIMDVGTYNDNLVTPSGYTAMDKYTLGWITPAVLDAPRKDFTLNSFGDTDETAFIVNPANADEYYTIENRRQEHWDKGLPGHGLVISYCHYDKRLWNRNVVNASSAGYEHVRIMAADNSWGDGTREEAGDPYPGTFGVTTLSGTTRPAATWKSSGIEIPVEWSISNIRENEDGSVTFDFNTTAGTDSIGDDMNGIRINGNSIESPEGSRIFDISGNELNGKSLPSGIYIVKTSSGICKVRL